MKYKKRYIVYGFVAIAIFGIIVVSLTHDNNAPSNINELSRVVSPQKGAGVAQNLRFYEIQNGDTLEAIAERFHLSVETIVWNNPNLLVEGTPIIKEGMQLIILPVDGILYEWQDGDSLLNVAQRYGTTVEKIIEFPTNRLGLIKNSEGKILEIAPGSKIILPGAQQVTVENLSTEVVALSIKYSNLGKAAQCEITATAVVGTGTFIWPTSTDNWRESDEIQNAIVIIGRVGDPVIASDTGVVVFVDDDLPNNLYRIVIDHGNGWHTVYRNLEKTNINCGEVVFQGDLIGSLGVTKTDLSSLLQFEIYSHNIIVNPREYLPDS